MGILSSIWLLALKKWKITRINTVGLVAMAVGGGTLLELTSNLFEKSHRYLVLLTQNQNQTRLMTVFFFFTIYHQSPIRLFVFLGIFSNFFPRKRIFCTKSLEKLKVQKWCQNGSNSIIKGVMSNFGFFEIQKSNLLL